MLLAELAETSQQVASTPRRLEKIRALADCVRRFAPEEIEIGVPYLYGETRQKKLGVGPAIIAQARTAVASSSPLLSLSDVDQTLERLVRMTGAGSMAGRRQVLYDLFASATRAEQVFLMQLLIGELRQGALEGVMLDAIALAAQLPARDVRRSAMLAGGIALAARVALTEGVAGLQRFSLQIFHPLLPMLSLPAQDVTEALQQLGTAAFEWKLDGARVQAHKLGSEVRLYSRGLNEVSVAVPELVESIRALRTTALILDGEAIALRPDGSPHPFQLTMRRFGRRLDVEAMRRELPLSVLFFDCLRRDDDDLTGRPAQERFAMLADVCPPELMIPRLITADDVTAQAFYESALARGHEGVMAKALDAPYEAGSRGSSWLKIKQAHTLDLVVLAAEWGHGRRRGWLSNLHLGARDPQSGDFVMLGKTFKGLTDQMLEWQTQTLLGLETHRDAYTVYVRPELVAEIAVNEIQASPHYPAGLALRFARVKRYRNDKRAQDADTLDAVRRLFTLQSERAAQPQG